MIDVAGQTAPNAAKTVAASLGAQVKSHAQLPQTLLAPTTPIQVPTSDVISQAVSSKAPNLSGRWVELDDPQPWIFRLKQMGEVITGFAGTPNIPMSTTIPTIQTRPKKRPADATTGFPYADQVVMGSVHEDQVILEFNMSLHWRFLLRSVDGRLVGTKEWSSGLGSPAHPHAVVLERRS